MESLIKMENVGKVYGSGATRVEALKNITLEITKGEFVAILGKSGSGKSTFISIIGGLIQPTSGTMEFNGIDLSTLSENELALIRRKEIGVVFQHFYLMDMLTALENVELPLLIANFPRKERRPKAVKVLNRVGLGDRMANYPEELSGGEKQRVGIARALVNKPSLILADEPTGDLDTSTGDKIIELLMEVNQDPEWNSTIIMVTHDVTKLRKGMRVLTMKDGRIIGDTIFDGKDVTQFDRFGVASEVQKSTVEF